MLQLCLALISNCELAAILTLPDALVTCVLNVLLVLRLCASVAVCCVLSDLERVTLDACHERMRKLVLVGALIESLDHHSLTTGIATSQHNHHLARLDAEQDTSRHSNEGNDVSDGNVNDDGSSMLERPGSTSIDRGDRGTA